MSPQPAPAPDRDAAPVRARSRRWWWVAAFVLVAASAVAWWRFYIPPIETVVVRPFSDAPGSAAWLGQAMTEEIADVLRPATKPHGDPRYTAVLDGAIVQHGRTVHITATLTRPDGHRYWTKKFDVPLQDAAVVVAGAVVRNLKARPRKLKPDTYLRYLDARHQFRSGEFAKAAAKFEELTDSDPGFGIAWAWLAISREHVVDLGAARPNDLLPGARDAAERAVTLEPDLPESHLALGIVKLQYDWDWETARREIDRALELSPGDPLILRWRDRYLEAMNQAPVRVELPSAPRDADAARQLLDRADDLREQSYVPAATLVLAAGLTKDAESAVRWLYEAYDERSAQLPYLLRSPALPLSDPRVLTLIRRLKLPTTHP